MKAAVLYLNLDDGQADIVNRRGWSCLIGKTYLNAQKGEDIEKAKKFGMYELAAGLNIENAEQAVSILQNVNHSWAEYLDPRVEKVYTRRPRSMSPGDIIVWEDGRREICDRIGFKEVHI